MSQSLLPVKTAPSATAISMYAVADADAIIYIQRLEKNIDMINYTVSLSLCDYICALFMITLVFVYHDEQWPELNIGKIILLLLVLLVSLVYMCDWFITLLLSLFMCSFYIASLQNRCIRYKTQ